MKIYKSKFTESTQNPDDGMTDEESEAYNQHYEKERERLSKNVVMPPQIRGYSFYKKK